jgi:hypothetical protein
LEDRPRRSRLARLSDDSTCRACGHQTPHAFCPRCWRLAPIHGRAELAWWLGEFRAAAGDDDSRAAFAAWQITATWLADLIKVELRKRQAKRVARKTAPKRRAKSLKELADEADARA